MRCSTTGRCSVGAATARRPCPRKSSKHRRPANPHRNPPAIVHRRSVRRYPVAKVEQPWAPDCGGRNESGSRPLSVVDTLHTMPDSMPRLTDAK